MSENDGIELQDEQLESERVAGMGVDVLRMFGGVDALLVAILVNLYKANESNIHEAARRLFYMSEANFDRLCKMLTIATEKRAALRGAFDVFAEQGANLLFAIVAAKRK